jgi:hypothetical protein
MMVMKRALFLSFIAALGISLASCDGRLKWHSSGKNNYDSLFLGIYLGMDKQAFYDHCWELNRQKVFRNGPKNQSVEYMLQGLLDQPVSMEFYPTFYKDKIVDMPVTFSYQAWAPWNKQYSSDSLLVKILPIFKKWYGEDFKILQHPTMGTIYVKMDGKRRINLFIRDDQFVQAVFTDMELDRERKLEGSD